MNHTQEVNQLEKSLKLRFDDLHSLKSKYDLTEQDILHYIEFEKYDAVAGAKLLKKLKETRVERRNIKNEYEELQSILMKMKNSGLHNYKRPNKNYTYRVVSLESILEN